MDSKRLDNIKNKRWLKSTFYDFCNNENEKEIEQQMLEMDVLPESIKKILILLLKIINYININ